MAGTLVGRWRFENDLTDASGNGNTLTGNGSPTYNNSDLKEGSYSLNLVRGSSQCAYIADASLASGFPLKYGESNFDITICGWVKADANLSGTTYSYIWHKNAVFRAFFYGATLNVYIANNLIISRGGCVTGRWYFIALSREEATGKYIGIVWDDTAQALVWDGGGTGAWHYWQEPYTTRFTLGGSDTSTNTLEGRIDDFRVYNGPLNRDELLAVKDNNYPPTAQLNVTEVHAQVEYTPATANDFSNDVTCVADWRLENGALTTDSKSTNTLTDSGCSADTSEFKEGAACLSCDGTHYLSITDANLATGFPTKNGDTTKVFSICGFFKSPSSLPGSSTYQAVIAKQHSTTYSWWLGLNNSRLKFIWRYSGATGYTYDVYASNLATSTWYFFCVVIDGANKTFQSWMWNAGTGAYWGGATQSPLNVLQVNAANLGIGANGDGANPMASGSKIDEISFFNRKLTFQDAQNIFNLAYNNNIGADRIEAGQVMAQVEYEEPPQIRVEQVMAQVEYDEVFPKLPVTDISHDDGIKAAWRFEDISNPLVDSKGSNTLVQSGTANCESNLSWVKKGNSSLFVPSGGLLTVADASLDAGFPLKNGDTTKQISVAFWFYAGTVTNRSCIFGKWNNATSAGRSFRIYTQVNGYFSLTVHPTSGSDESFNPTGLPLVANAWNHLVLCIDGVNKYAYWSLFNGTTMGTNRTALANELNVGTDPYSIANYGDNTGTGVTGYYDDIIVFNRFLDAIEVSSLHAGTYDKVRTGNDFGTMPALQGRWLFHTDAGLVDTAGKNNNLTDLGSSGQLFGGINTTPEKLASSAETKRSNFITNRGTSSYQSLPEAGMSSNFPMKSDDTDRQFSISLFWCPIPYAATYYGGTILGKKQELGASYPGWSLEMNATDSKVYFYWSNGTTEERYDIIPAFQSCSFPNIQEEWFHIFLVIDGLNKTLKARVTNYLANTVTNYTYTPTIQLGLNTKFFGIGKLDNGGVGGASESLVADVTVFNTLFTVDADMDAIRDYEYTYSGAVTATVDATNLVLTQLDSLGKYPINISVDAISLLLTQYDVTTIQRAIAYATATNVPITQQTLTAVIRALGEPGVSSLALTQLDVTPFYTYCRKFPVYPDERQTETQTGKRSFPNRR